MSKHPQVHLCLMKINIHTFPCYQANRPSRLDTNGQMNVHLLLSLPGSLICTLVNCLFAASNQSSLTRLFFQTFVHTYFTNKICSCHNCLSPTNKHQATCEHQTTPAVVAAIDWQFPSLPHYRHSHTLRVSIKASIVIKASWSVIPVNVPELFVNELNLNIIHH